MLLNLIDVTASALIPFIQYFINSEAEVTTNLDQTLNLYIAKGIDNLLSVIGIEVLIYHVCMKR